MESDFAISTERMDKAILAWMQDLAPQGIFVTDSELRVQSWNTWLELNSGLNKSEVIGREVLEIFPDLKARKLDGYFKKALAGGASILSVALHRYLFPFRSPVPESGFPNMLQTVRIAPLMLGDEIVGTITIIEDVTEREYQHSILRKQSERQELFSWVLSHLLQAAEPEKMVKEIFPRISAHIGVDSYSNYLIDEDGETLRLHSSGGITSDVQKQFATMKIGEHLTGTTALNRQTIVLSDIQKSKEEIARKSKDFGYTAAICHPLLVDGRVIGTLAFVTRKKDHFEDDEIEFTKIMAQYTAIALERSRNIKALTSAQKQLLRQADLLESEVQTRTAELRESLNELESFSYSLAHDVRAPLRHIRGYAEALLEDCERDLGPDARGYVDSILKAIQRLDALTQDILDYGQLSQKPVSGHPVVLDELLKDIISHHPKLSAHGVTTVRTPLDVPIAERPLLAQCLTNLLDNAVKFVPANVTPKILIYTQQKFNEDTKKQWVRIFIEDNGIGIPEEYHARIFGIFERLGTENDFEGTGIGLAIVAKAMQRMGGRLGLSSEIGKGTTFWLELPAYVP